MKKKVLTAILPLCVAVAMTACGGNADTKEAAETAVTEESEAEKHTETVEPEAEEPTDDVSVEEPAAEPELTDEEKLKAEMNAYEFMTVTKWAAEQDKSSSYGVNSTSCYDLREFLDADGVEIWNNDWEATERNEYSGRWAYPELVANILMEHALVMYRTDEYEMINTWKNEPEESIDIYVFSGQGYYNSQVKQYEWLTNPEFDESEVNYSIPYSIDVMDESVDVVLNNLVRSMFPVGTEFVDGKPVDSEGNEVEGEIAENIDLINFKIGDFSVEVRVDHARGLTQDEIQLIADSIKFVGDMAE